MGNPINYSQDRPLKKLWQPDLLAIIAQSLLPVQPDPELPPQPNLELATFAFDELCHRGKKEKAKILFSEAGYEPIDWLQEARTQLKRLTPPTGEQHKDHLYAILISGYTKINGFYGVYVGSSKYTAEERFKKHKLGIDHSKRVFNRGIQILESLCWPFGTVPGGKERRLWETSLHIALEAAVPRVSGDTVKLKNISTTFENYKVCAQTK